MAESQVRAPPSWKHRPEGGTRGSLALIVGIARHGGRGLARLCLYPITLYFLLVRGPERRASRAWLARVRGRDAGPWDVARHIHTFASTILDRVFLLGGQTWRFDIRVHGLDPLVALVDQGRGALLFGSHLGSFDVLRVLATRRPDYVIRVVLDKGQSPAMMKLLDALNPAIAANVIDAAQDGPSVVMAMKQALEDGALVAMLVDRARPGEPALPVAFLGGSARFPTTPWLIAAALKVPVVLGFGLYRGGNRYDLVFEPFSDGLDIPRERRRAELASLIRRYAERLEHHARSAPLNWFNFYDFWSVDEQPAPSALDDAALRRRTAVRRDDARADHGGR